MPRVWGRQDLSPWFPDEKPETPIGEVWFTGAGPEAEKLLLKLLFTSARLSVQVHPGDQYAALHHGGRGKTEAWFVLDATPEARLGLGLRETVSADAARRAALDGSIERLLDWRAVSPGQCWLVPAGTIHALGPGLTVFEVQQNSDLTYRLYDYGRPRQLHLEHALAVASLGPYTLPPAGPSGPLVACPYFSLERLQWSGEHTLDDARPSPRLVLVLGGPITLAGFTLVKGEVWLIPAGALPLSLFAGEGDVLVATPSPA